MTNVERQVARLGKFSKVRPAGVRDLRLSGSKLTWVEPTDTTYISHYNVRVGSDTGTPTYQVQVGQNSCVVSAGDKDFWVSAANKTMGTESPMALVRGTANGGVGSGSLIGAPTGLSASAATTDTDGILLVTVTGTLPTDGNLAGLRFIVERPIAADPFPAVLTLPGELNNTIPVWYTGGDGSAFTQTFTITKPTRAEKVLIYCLPFAEGYENPLVRLTQHSPVLPANVTAYAVLDITTSLTVAGSELTDITLTGSPVLTPTGIGTLRVNHLYVPPYLAGPVVSIGDFQGVTVWYVNESGEVSNLGDQPYLPPVAFDATPPDNLGSISAIVPMPTDGATIHFVVCSYSTTKHLPYRDPGTAPAAIVITIAIDSGVTGGGLATQVSLFNVTIESRYAGGANSGAKELRFKYDFTPPVDAKWNFVSIRRTRTDSSFVAIPGGESGVVAELNAAPGYSDWFGMPQALEYWHFVAESANFDTPPTLNTFSAPMVNVTLTPSGELVNAALSITAAMLQDLAVEARALADYAVTTSKYAPLSIVAAAIGLAAINDANIANLNVSKLTGTSMSITGALNIAATGSLTLQGYSGAQSMYVDTFGVNAGSFYGDLLADNIFAKTASPLTFHTAFDFSSSGDSQSTAEGLLASIGALSGTPTYFFTKNGGGVGYHTLDLTDILNALSLIISGGTSGKYLQNNGSGVLWADPESGMGSNATVNPSTLTSLTLVNGRVTAYA